MIISGGVNIYPQEVENELTMHPAVADVAVIGVPNADLGEEVKAVVIPADPSAAGDELGAGADRLLPFEARALQVPGLGRLRRRAAASPDRQAAQAPAPRPVLGHRLTDVVSSPVGRSSVGSGRASWSSPAPSRSTTSG